MIAADPKTSYPAGAWITIVIKVKDGHVTHAMNGVEVLSYALWTTEWDNLVTFSKFSNFQDLLKEFPVKTIYEPQNHGYNVWYRNVKSGNFSLEKVP